MAIHFAHQLFFVACFYATLFLQQNVAMSPKRVEENRAKLFETNEPIELINTIGPSNGSKIVDDSPSSSTNPISNNESNDKATPFDCMSCAICYEDVNIDRICFCDHLMTDKNCDEQNESHTFCIECLRQYTKTAHETVPFARGGLGLKCMVPKCANPISWQEIRALITDQKESIQALENHCAELCVAMCGLSFLERCKYSPKFAIFICPKCNCAVEMRRPPTDGTQKFRCPECGNEICRKCKEQWAEEHNDLSCEQFAKQQNRQGYQMEKILSEVIVHKCHKCNIRFVKYDGCNYVKCANNECEATHCYCCRMPDICGNHFCVCSQKVADPANPSKCANVDCGKCLQSANIAEFEQHQMELIRKENDGTNVGGSS